VTADAREPSWEWLGNAMVVSPGPLGTGRAALVDLADKQLQPLELG
jgi:Icc-related predicted phosphoesterase